MSTPSLLPAPPPPQSPWQPKGQKEQHGVIKGAGKAGLGGGLGADIEARGERMSDMQILREVAT